MGYTVSELIKELESILIEYEEDMPIYFTIERLPWGLYIEEGRNMLPPGCYITESEI